MEQVNISNSEKMQILYGTIKDISRKIYSTTLQARAAKYIGNEKVVEAANVVINRLMHVKQFYEIELNTLIKGSQPKKEEKDFKSEKN